MQIEVLPYERRALESLEVKFSLDRGLIVGIAEDLSALRRLFNQIISYPGPEFRAGRVVIMGLINHAHYLLIGGLQAVDAGNPAVWSSCARGLIETFGAGVLISERPTTAPNYLEHVGPGKLYAAADRARPGLGDDVKRLHKIVHPATGAIYAANTSIDRDARTGIFEFGLRQPSPDAGREGVTFLGNIAMLIAEKFEALATNDAVLAAGKVILDKLPNKPREGS